MSSSLSVSGTVTSSTGGLPDDNDDVDRELCEAVGRESTTTRGSKLVASCCAVALDSRLPVGTEGEGESTFPSGLLFRRLMVTLLEGGFGVLRLELDRRSGVLGAVGWLSIFMALSEVSSSAFGGVIEVGSSRGE